MSGAYFTSHIQVSLSERPYSHKINNLASEEARGQIIHNRKTFSISGRLLARTKPMIHLEQQISDLILRRLLALVLVLVLALVLFLWF